MLAFLLAVVILRLCGRQRREKGLSFISKMTKSDYYQNLNSPKPSLNKGFEGEKPVTTHVSQERYLPEVGTPGRMDDVERGKWEDTFCFPTDTKS